jgi:hypothetical protein
MDLLLHGTKAMKQVSTRSPASHSIARQAGVLCAGWEIVCPDGRVRHYPFHNLDDAEDAAGHCAKRCDPYKIPSDLMTSQPPCPHGTHTVRPVVMQDKALSRGQS